MPSAGEWFWSSELGRDNLLRHEIEGLQASAYRARDQSARLSSQLNRLQGSIETRLSALSAAFDAYVELGDVREPLAGYPDTSAARRDAIDAIETLSRGGTPDPVPDRGLDYWLPWAVNATITLLAGAPDRAAEERAVQLSPEAEWFIVAAAGALGPGPPWPPGWRLCWSATGSSRAARWLCGGPSWTGCIPAGCRRWVAAGPLPWTSRLPTGSSGSGSRVGR